MVGVLVLVDEEVAPAPAVMLQHRGDVLEQEDGAHQQVVEVESPGRGQLGLVGAVDAGGLDLEVAARPGGEGRRVEQLVLGRAHHVHDLGGGQALVVDAGRLHRPAHGREPIGLVVDHEVGGDADRVAIPAEDAGAHGVEGPQPHPADVGAEQLLHPAAHLPRRLVGEGYRQDLLGTHTAGGDDVGDAMGEHPGLATAGAREDQEGAVRGLHRLALGRVEGGEQRVGLGNHVGDSTFGGSLTRLRAPHWGRPSAPMPPAPAAAEARMRSEPGVA